MATPLSGSAGHLTDAQARNLVIKALRETRKVYRTADTLGEKVERELDRLIMRKTRINASSFQSLNNLYSAYFKQVEAIASMLTTAYEAASFF